MPTKLYFRSTEYTGTGSLPASGWNHLSQTDGGSGITGGANGVLGYDIAYNPTAGRWLIVGDSGLTNFESYMAWSNSPNGPWNYFRDPAIYRFDPAVGGINCTVFVPSSGLFVVADDSGRIFTSPSAESGTWTNRYTPPAPIFTNKINLANGFVVVTCSASTIIYSGDGGLTWTTANVGFTGSSTGVRGECTWDGTRFIVVGQGGQLSYATTLAGTWTLTNVGTTTVNCWSLAYSPTLGRYCVGMENSTIRTTTTPLTPASWTVATGTFLTAVSMVRWANGRFVAVSDGRGIGFSTTGTAFTVTFYNNSTTRADIWGVYNFDNSNTWYAVTEYYPSLLWRSTDNGSNWQPTGTENSINAITAGLPTVERKGQYSLDAFLLRSLATTPGTTQRQATFTSIPSVVVNQTVYIGAFASQPLANNQTVGGGTMILNTADGESNLNLNFWINAVNVFVWRPSTGSVVGFVRDATNVSLGGAETTVASVTAAYVTNITGITSTAVAAQAGDIVVAEVWGRFTSGMATAYNGYFYYDGATETTVENTLVTNHASFIQLTETLTFQSAQAPTDTGNMFLLFY